VIQVSRAEVCVIACAELFRDAGEIMVSPMTNMASVGARLARLTFSPDIALTDGEAQLLADTPALGKTGAVEGWMPFSRVFETLAWGWSSTTKDVGIWFVNVGMRFVNTGG